MAIHCDEEKDLFGEPVKKKTSRRVGSRHRESMPPTPLPPAAPAVKFALHLPSFKSFIWLIGAVVACVAFHAYSFQFKGVVPGAEAEKMPLPVYGAIVAVLCAALFCWFVFECAWAVRRQFQDVPDRSPWHWTGIRRLPATVHCALVVANLFMLWLASYGLPYGLRDTRQFVSDAYATFSRDPDDRPSQQITSVEPSEIILRKAAKSAQAQTMPPPTLADPPHTVEPRVVTGSISVQRKIKKPPETSSEYPLDPLLKKICDWFGQITSRLSPNSASRTSGGKS